MIRLKDILAEAYRNQVYEFFQRNPDILKSIFSEFNETPAEWLGGGFYGSAYATQAGKVIKFTNDPDEVALAARISKRARRPHLINIYDVRPFSSFSIGLDQYGDPRLANGFYAIHMDKIIPLMSMSRLAADTWWNLQSMYFSTQPDEAVRRSVNFEWEKHRLTRDAYDILLKIVDQRQKVLQDVRAMHIKSGEAHEGNIGFTPEGNFVLYDLQATKHPSQSDWIDPIRPSKSTLGKTVDMSKHVKYTTDGIDTPGDPNM